MIFWTDTLSKGKWLMALLSGMPKESIWNMLKSSHNHQNKRNPSGGDIINRFNPNAFSQLKKLKQ
jgi:hypothetical protein